MGKRNFLLLGLAIIASITSSYAQKEEKSRSASLQAVNLKTNLVYDATATFNLGVEWRLNDHASLEIPLNWNPLTFSHNRKWKHFLIQPEYRHWVTESFSGHFFGLHAHYAYYNIGNLPKPFSGNMRDKRYQGWLLGAGLSYGYRWNIDSRWGLEATLGIGYAYLDYQRAACEKCSPAEGYANRHYIGPTKVGLSLIYGF